MLEGRVLTIPAAQPVLKCAKLVPYSEHCALLWAESALRSEHFEAFMKTATELNAMNRDLLAI